MKIIIRYSLVILTIMVSLYSNAQQRGKGFIGVSSGLSSPTGAFSKTDIGSFGNWNNSSGFAKTGFNAGIEGAYYVLQKFGIGGVLNYSDHGTLSHSDVQKLANSYTDAFAVDYSIVTINGRYRTLNFLVGPYFSLPYKKITFDLRLLGGLTQSLTTPEISVQLENNPNTFIQRSASTSAFGWQAGIGMRYALTKKLALSLREDYFNSSGIKINNVNRVNNAGRLVTKQPMSWMNGAIGLVYTIGK